MSEEYTCMACTETLKNRGAEIEACEHCSQESYQEGFDEGSDSKAIEEAVSLLSFHAGLNKHNQKWLEDETVKFIKEHEIK